MEVKEIIPNLNRYVLFEGSTYLLKGGIIRKDENGKIYYSAELLDKNERSILYAKLEKVKLR